MRLAAFLLLAALAASATAGAAGTPVALIASPAHLALVAPGTGTVRVTNTGSEAVVVDVARAGFGLDLRGRPRVVSRPGRWIVVRPSRLSLAAGASAAVAVSARLPAQPPPGDHAQLVLLTTRPAAGTALAVRVRLGVVVVVRAPGRVVRRLRVLRVRVAGRRLELLIANRGNVTESLAPACLSITLWRGRRLLARLRAAGRELLPRTTGLVEVPYRGRQRGRAVVRIVSPPGSRCAPGLRGVFPVSL